MPHASLAPGPHLKKKEPMNGFVLDGIICCESPLGTGPNEIETAW